MRSCPTCFVPYAEQVEFCGLDGSRLIDVTGDDPLIGRRLERFRITGLLGDGGMARVYRADHETLHRAYAVKVLYGEVASNKTLAERFRREAKAMSQIAHENIVAVVDYGVTAAGITFLAMDLVEGETLRSEIKRAGLLAPRRAARIARQIALGLGAAHRMSFVHRDLKPSNVMLVPRAGGDLVKLVDFGLVRALENDEKDGFLTKTGQFVGTPIYMSPEQIVGTEIDARADLYALGVVLYEMLEGKPPFLAKKLAEVRRMHLESAPPRPRRSAGLEDLVVELMAKEAADRPADTDAVVARLAAMDILLDDTADTSGTKEIEIPPPLVETHGDALLSSSIAGEPIDRRRRSPLLLALAAAVIATTIALVLRSEDGGPAAPPIVKRPMPAPPLAVDPPIAPPIVDPPIVAPPANPVTPPPPPPVEPPRRAEKRRSQVAKPKAEPRRSDPRIPAAIAARGLSIADVAKHSTTRSAYAAWSQEQGDPDKTDALEEAIRQLPIDAALVHARLDRISARLLEASSRLPLEQIRTFEDRYLEIEAAARKDLTAEQAERELIRATALLRELSAALK